MKKNVLLLLGIYLTIYIFSGCKSENRNAPSATNGYLDLSKWDFEKNGDLVLDGNWEFYWNKLYTPHDFQKDSLPAMPTYVAVPHMWNDMKIGSEILSGEGFATYRLKVKLSQVYDILGIKLLDASSSYKLWINNTLIATNGKVSTVLSDIKPQLLPQVKTFAINSDKIEIIVQVANNFHYKGGLWESIRIGTTEQIMMARERNVIYNLFLTGILFILAIYQFWIYLLGKKEKGALWFGILCFSVFIRTLLINERILYDFFPNFDINIGYRLEYLSIFMLPLFFALYFYYLFEKIFPKYAVKIILVFSVIEFIIILMPTHIYTAAIIPIQIILYAEYLYFFSYTFKLINQKQSGAMLFLLSWIVVLTLGMNDILHLNGVINTMQVGHYAFFVFLLTQAYIISSKIANAYNKLEDLSVNLERKVEQRTQELKESQTQLVESEKMAAFGAVATRVAHEIQNPLNFVTNFSNLSQELVNEIIDSKNEEEKNEAAKLLIDNLQKIEHHGKRASNIVKELFKHTRDGTVHEYFEA